MTFTRLTCTFIKRSALLACLLLPHTAFAEEKPVDILPPVTHAQAENIVMQGDATHDILRLTPDKSELIDLDKDAASIIIGNPAHINVIADSSKRLVVVPRIPGATHFMVIGTNGAVIMQRHVIVASPKKDYIKVKRTCTGDDCQATSVYYCPDMCHEIHTDSGDKKNAAARGQNTKDNKDGANNRNSSDNDVDAPNEEEQY